MHDGIGFNTRAGDASFFALHQRGVRSKDPTHGFEASG